MFVAAPVGSLSLPDWSEPNQRHIQISSRAMQYIQSPPSSEYVLGTQHTYLVARTLLALHLFEDGSAAIRPSSCF
jgi:hypothetical protein